MEFLWSYYRQQGADSVSLLVQHYTGQEEIGIACLCTDEQDKDAGAYLTKQLMVWFRGLSVRKLKKYNQKGTLGAKLLRMMLEWENDLLSGTGISKSADRQLKELAVFLCVGESFWLVYRGSVKIYSLHTAFNRAHIEDLKQSAEIEMSAGEYFLCRGMMQEDVGLLLATDTLMEKVSLKMLQDSLFVGEMKIEQQMKRHLTELAMEAMRLGGDKIGAILLRSRRMPVESCTFSEGDFCFCSTANCKTDAEENVIKEAPGRTQEYRWGRLLGKGGFSKVYYVTDSVTGEVYACKVSEDAELLYREYKVMRKLRHPLFVQAFDFWQAAGKGYLLMEYVPGSNLGQMLSRRGGFSEKQTIVMGRELASGLLYLHEVGEGLIFRDIKPENIILRQDGRLKLMDFGCVCRREDSTKSRAGTVGFAAPEQFVQGELISVRSDVYGWGRTMQVLLRENKKTADGRFKELLEKCTADEACMRPADMRCVLTALVSFEKRKRSIFQPRGSAKYVWEMQMRKNIWECTHKNS